MAEKHLEQARTEMETLKICQHKNIMRLYEVFENADNIYLVLEYLGGGNLYNYMKEHQLIIKESMAKRLIKSVTSALHYLHKYGVIHRDIKPDNVVFESTSEDCDVKLVDFGLAKILEPNEMATEPVGTLCYAAPEILLGNKYNSSVDLWSLGVLLYWILSGNLPFSPELPEKQIAEYYKLIFRNIVTRNLEYKELRWKNVSPEAMKLVKGKVIFNCRIVNKRSN